MEACERLMDKEGKMASYKKLGKMAEDGIWGLVVGDALGVPVEFFLGKASKRILFWGCGARVHIISRREHGRMILPWLCAGPKG